MTAAPRGLMRRIVEGAADALSQASAVPPENRAAFRATAVSIIEQQILAVIGRDTVRVSGWVMAPSQRSARRARIVAALRANELPVAIAARERCSVRRVEQIRGELLATPPAADAGEIMGP